MRRECIRGFEWLLILLVSTTAASSEPADRTATEVKGQEQRSVSEEAAEPALVYQPPALGAPKARVGAGTRGDKRLLALAPGHVALSSVPQPRLYWYLAPGVTDPVRFRLSDGTGAPPVLDILFDPWPEGGIRSLDLSKQGVQLAPENTYRWTVSIERKGGALRPGVISGGNIRLSSSVGREEPEDIYTAARQGLWHDALDAVSRRIEEDPASPRWRKLRAELLGQAGLREAADADRAGAVQSP